MISGVHVIICSTNAEADRAFLRDVIGFKSVDAGHGWLIFGLPAAEAAFHPSEADTHHKLYLMSDDVRAEIDALRSQGVRCSELVEARWGSITTIQLPGGSEIGLYQPKHPRPER